MVPTCTVRAGLCALGTWEMRAMGLNVNVNESPASCWVGGRHTPQDLLHTSHGSLPVCYLITCVVTWDGGWNEEY